MTPPIQNRKALSHVAMHSHVPSKPPICDIYLMSNQKLLTCTIFDW